MANVLLGVGRRFAGPGSRRLLREGRWVFAGHAVVAIAGLVSIRVLTELVPQSVFGGANLLVGMLTLGMHVLVAPVTQTQLRYHTVHNDAGAGERYTLIVARTAAACALLVVVVSSLVLLAWPAARMGAGPSVVAWLAILTAALTLKSVLINRMSAERKQQTYASWLATEAMLVLICSASVLAYWPTIEGFVAGQAAGVAVAMALFGRWPGHGPRELSPDEGRRLQHEAARQFRTYGLPFAAFAVLGWASNLADRYVLAGELDMAAIGQYVAAFAIASRLPTLLSMPLNDLFRPVLFDAASRNEPTTARKVFAAWLAILAGIAAAIIVSLLLFGDFVASLLLAESYRPGAREIMCWIALGYGLLSIAQVVENRLLALGASRILLVPKFVGAAANIVGALLLVPAFGLIGAAMANAFAQGAQLLVLLGVGYRRHSFCGPDA